MIHVDRCNLAAEFDKIRKLLDPWQIWFFQKRRVVRLLDKVFNKEFNLKRVEEFKTLVERRLDSKRMKILDNSRSQIKFRESEDEKEKYLANIDTIELIDVHLFDSHSRYFTKFIVNRLVEKGMSNIHDVIPKIFPDSPRDTNDNFYMNALWFLMAFNERISHVDWLPAWLLPSKELEEFPKKISSSIKRLISLSLTSFSDDEARKIILLVSTTFRRIFKILIACEDNNWKIGQISHAIVRYTVPELSWAQIRSSPSVQMLDRLDNVTMGATLNFVKEYRSGQVNFNTQNAKRGLMELWNIEMDLLTNFDNYTQSVKERGLDEVHPTEMVNVTYDYLGNSCLCAIEMFPSWKDYVLSCHRSAIEALAKLGCWQAKKWLGIELTTRLPLPDDLTIAHRFFFDDVETLRALKKGYKIQ